MRVLIIILAAATAVAAGDEPAAVAGRLQVNADAASVTILSTPGGHRFVRLPTLEFPLRIEPLCAATYAATSMSVSIADSRLRLAPGDMSAQPVIETTLALPRQQTGPLRVDGFCSDEDAVGSARTLLIEDAFTARLSLTCAGAETATILYATLPLDVRLTCEAGDTIAAGRSDQDASDPESSPRF